MDERQDELYQEILTVCRQANDYSTRFIQKTFKIGYARACSIRDHFFESGVLTKTKADDTELYSKVIDACTSANDFTVDFVQRNFSIGYARAEAILKAYSDGQK